MPLRFEGAGLAVMTKGLDEVALGAPAKVISLLQPWAIGVELQ